MKGLSNVYLALHCTDWYSKGSIGVEQRGAGETGKDTGVQNYQTQLAMTAIGFLWALYSDGWQSKMADSYPNWPSCLLFPGQTFYNGE